MKVLELTEREATIYVLLSKKGPLDEDELVFALNTSKSRLCQSLKNLETKKMVKVSQKNIARYSAITLKKVLNAKIKKSTQQAKELQSQKDELLAIWGEMSRAKK